MTIPEIDG